MVDEQPTVTIYTDGAAEPNPGPGGYGVVLLFGKHRKELSAGYRLTTNNRMELLAVIAGLEALTRPCKVTVCSDSKYVVDSVENGSALRWRSNNWFRTRTQQAKNPDLWQRFLAACEKHSVKLEWIPGHQGIAENERCDQLAVDAARSDELLVDSGYELPTDASFDGKHANSGKPNITHTEPGEQCRKCGTALIKRIPKRKKRSPRQSYYYEWYLYCTGCKAMYMVEAAKRRCDNLGSTVDGAS